MKLDSCGDDMCTDTKATISIEISLASMWLRVKRVHCSAQSTAPAFAVKEVSSNFYFLIEMFQQFVSTRSKQHFVPDLIGSVQTND